MKAGNSHITSAPLDPIVQDLRNGKIDLHDQIDLICDHIDSHDPVINSLLPEPGYRDRLHAEAELLQKAYPITAERPSLYGILVGVKDIIRVEGFLTRGGSQLDPGLFNGPEASVVSLLRQAGALILGKTVTTEFAYFEPGPTRNPHNIKHSPGGSSSGSAAAVAAGFCQLSLGTQTIASINRPAAFCGIIGYKPSYGRIPSDGILRFSRSADHLGYFCQDISGIIRTARVLCSGWHDLNVTHRPVMAIPRGKYLEQAETEALKTFNLQISKLHEAGYTVKEVNILDDLEAVTARHQALISAEFAVEHSSLYSQFANFYRPRTAGLIEEGWNVSENELAEARISQKMLREELETVMSSAGIDLWLAPAATGSAPAGIEYTGNPAMSLPWTNAGLPALSLPAGVSGNGLPLGLQIVGSFQGDELLLAWAKNFAEVFIDYQAYRKNQ